MMPVFAFDFDGVISESLLEAYLITWRIAGKFRPELAPPSVPPTLDTIRAFRTSHPEHWTAFEALVPLGNRCEDYLVIQAAVKEGRRLTLQREFTEYRKGFSDLFPAFHAAFYRERYALSSGNPAGWLALNAPYPGIGTALNALSRHFSLAVATSKDGPSVRSLLAAYKVDSFFPGSAILDKSTGESKRAHLTRLCEIFDCSFSDIFFIDDKITHLIDCSGLGVRCFLAGWGYNGTEEHRAAAAQGFPVLDIEQLGKLRPALRQKV